ncbi:MAG: pyridoxal-phosphate dependent enzyme [Nitrososphaeria archaeon]|nr:pyridoxal-phosphate dependent enzyme [Nitrososphaeria archaeon]
MEYTVKCSKCGKEDWDNTSWKCECGAPYNIILEEKFYVNRIERKNYSLWRYKKFYPYIKDSIVTLGEGFTPIIKVEDNLWFKLDFLMPTGSYKDRGSSILVSGIIENLKGINCVSEDSSGNAGASIAAYCARAALKAKIFVPENASGPKLFQIKKYGAEVYTVKGKREDVSAAAQNVKDSLYVGHSWHPYFKDGIRTLAYEIAEQMDWKTFDNIFLPVSAGTLLLGVIAGFIHLLDSGIIDKMPKIIACQTSQVSPLYHKLKGGKYIKPEKILSVADALITTNPPLLEEMYNMMKKIDGDAEIVNENEIIQAHTILAKKGVYVEPSSAVAYAAYLKRLKEKNLSEKENVLIILTGSGLKSAL